MTSLRTYTEIPNSDLDPESPITTSLMSNLRDNPLAMHQDGIGAPVSWRGWDGSLVNHGDGGDGALTISVNTTASKPIFECTTFTVNSGITLTSPFPFLIIRANDSITINGTINSRGNVDRSVHEALHPLSFIGGFGGAGGGGGASGSRQTYDGYACVAASGVSGGRGEGTGFNTIGGAGGNKTTYPSDPSAASVGGSNTEFSAAVNPLHVMSLYPTLRGGGDGANGVSGSSNGDGTAAGGAGGVGGGLIILIAPTITLASSAVFDVQGQDGGDGGAAPLCGGSDSGIYGAGGGGGGGGGSIFVIGRTVLDLGATATVAGGLGGAGGTGRTCSGCGGRAGGNGGAGGAGVFQSLVLTD